MPRGLLLLLLLMLLLASGVYLALSWQDEADSPVVLDVAPVEHPTRPEPGPGAPAVGASRGVRVDIEHCGELVEIAAIPALQVRRGREVVPAAVTWLAGPAAVPGIALAGRQLAKIELQGGDPFYRVVRLSGRSRPAEVDLAGPYSYRGRVVDAAGASVTGAVVWLAGRPNAESSADGLFEVDGLRGRDDLPLVIRAEGFAKQCHVVSWRPGLDVDPATFQLEDEAELIVRLAGTVPEAGPVEVHLRPAVADDGAVAIRHYPFYWSAIEAPPVLGADASCRLRGLPRGVRLEVTLRHPAFDAMPARVALREDVQEVTVRGRARRIVEGRVVGADGVGMSNVLVASQANLRGWTRRRAAGQLLPAAAELVGEPYAFTGPDGGFSVGVRDGKVARFWVMPYGPVGATFEAARDEEALEFVLPEAALDESLPALRFVASDRVRLQLAGRPAVDVSAGASHLHELKGPAVVNVEIMSGSEVRHLRRLLVTGIVDVEL